MGAALQVSFSCLRLLPQPKDFAQSEIRRMALTGTVATEIRNISRKGARRKGKNKQIPNLASLRLGGENSHS
jgi:hypothetical protein